MDASDPSHRHETEDADPTQPRGALRPHPHDPTTALMLIATFATGIADAIGYLGFDHIFTANMTGNVIILGMGLAGNDGLPVAGPIIALAAFFIGALASGRLLHRIGKGWSRPVALMFLVEAAALCTAGIALIMIPIEPRSGAMYAFTAITACALGCQAAAARKIGVKDVTTVVVTSTITGLASESRLAGGDGARSARKALAVLSIACGAVVGGILHRFGASWLAGAPFAGPQTGDGIGLILTGLILVAMTAAGRRIIRQ